MNGTKTGPLTNNVPYRKYIIMTLLKKLQFLGNSQSDAPQIYRILRFLWD